MKLDAFLRNRKRVVLAVAIVAGLPTALRTMTTTSSPTTARSSPSKRCHLRSLRPTGPAFMDERMASGAPPRRPSSGYNGSSLEGPRGAST